MVGIGILDFGQLSQGSVVGPIGRPFECERLVAVDRRSRET
ncbi:uncharacterized protein METZ01_LOCUS204323 [marine metagenome]|uniref:Uncharacterized protein n=1 Tax=marine metagenome TaxID=408172 RepID=A0A382EM44_9ZZZZ